MVIMLLGVIALTLVGDTWSYTVKQNLPGSISISMPLLEVSLEIENKSVRALEPSQMFFEPNHTYVPSQEINMESILIAIQGEYACSGSNLSQVADHAVLVSTSQECNVFQTVHNLAQKGAAAVIITADNLTDSSLRDRFGEYTETWFPITVPLFVIPRSQFTAMVNLQGSSIRRGEKLKRPRGPFMKYLIFGFPTLMGIWIVVLILYFIGVKTRDATPLEPTDKIRRTFDGKPNRFGQTQCIFCHEDYTDSCQLIVAPCEHDFHYECASDWLEEKKMCPLCTQQFRKVLA